MTVEGCRGSRPLSALRRSHASRLRGVADEAVDGVGRNDRAGALGERGGQRREVDARLGEVEAQRHPVRIPPRRRS